MACRVMHSPQPAAELHTSKKGEKRAWGDRVLRGITASHTLARAPGVDSNRHCKRMRQHKPPGGRPTLLRRTDGALSAAAWQILIGSHLDRLPVELWSEPSTSRLGTFVLLSCPS